MEGTSDVEIDDASVTVGGSESALNINSSITSNPFQLNYFRAGIMLRNPIALSENRLFKAIRVDDNDLRSSSRTHSIHRVCGAFLNPRRQPLIDFDVRGSDVK